MTAEREQRIGGRGLGDDRGDRKRRAGTYTLLTEPNNYDMQGVGFFVGVIFGLVCVLSWLLGRGFNLLLSR